MIAKKFIAFFLILCLSPLTQTIYCYWESPDYASKSLELDTSEVAMEFSEYQFNLIMEMVVHYNPRLSVWSRHRIVDQILKASDEFGLDPFLITSVIAAESSFRPSVISHCGAQGLMQLTPAVQPSLGVRNAFNIEENIRGGSLFLSQLRRRFNDTTLTLAAYNAGPTRVARLGRVPRIRETQCYVKRVQKLTTQLTQSFFAKLPASFLNGIHNLSTSDKLQSFVAFSQANSWTPAISYSTLLPIRFLTASTQKECFNAFSSTEIHRSSLMFNQVLPQSLKFIIRT